MPPSKEKYSTRTLVGAIVGLGLLSIIAGVVIFMIRKRNKRYTDDEGDHNKHKQTFELKYHLSY